MKGRNGKKVKTYYFAIIVAILTLFPISMQTVLANDQVSFTFDPNIPNQSPVVQDNEHPTNNSVNVNLKVKCHITVGDPDNDYLIIYWYENTTGVWVLRQTDSSLLNGTYHWNYLQAADYSTTYYWRVIVSDGNDSKTAIFCFSTRAEPSYPPSPPAPPIEPNKPPVANITGPNNAYINETLVFYAIYSYDSDGYINEYRWVFEDDTIFDTGWIKDEVITYSYEHHGNYTIVLHVKDDDGDISTASYIINIMQLEPNLKLPIPKINASYYYTYINKNITLPAVNGPYYGYTNENITFNSTGTYDPDGLIISYFWEFGDGNISYLENPIHSYAKPGEYTVILKVTDNNNLNNLTATKAIISDRQKPTEPEPEKERELPFPFLLFLIIAIIIAIIVSLLFLPNGYKITILVEEDPENKNEEENIDSKVDEILKISDNDNQKEQ